MVEELDNSLRGATLSFLATYTFLQILRYMMFIIRLKDKRLVIRRSDLLIQSRLEV